MIKLASTIWEIKRDDGEVEHITFLKNNYLKFLVIKSEEGDDEGQTFGDKDETWGFLFVGWWVYLGMVESILFLFNCTFEKVEDNMDYKTVTTKGGDKLEYAWRFYTISNAPVEAFIENKEDAINIIKKEGFEVEFNLDELEKHKLRKTDQKKMEILESLEELELYPEDLPLSMIPEIIVGDDGENYEEDVEESIVGDGQLWKNSSEDFDSPPFEEYYPIDKSYEKLGKVFDGPYLKIEGTVQEVRMTVNGEDFEFEYMDLDKALDELK